MSADHHKTVKEIEKHETVGQIVCQQKRVKTCKTKHYYNKDCLY